MAGRGLASRTGVVTVAAAERAEHVRLLHLNHCSVVKAHMSASLSDPQEKASTKAGLLGSQVCAPRVGKWYPNRTLEAGILQMSPPPDTNPCVLLGDSPCR